MKKLFLKLICVTLLVSICGCSFKSTSSSTNGTEITDALGNTAYITKDSRIAVCYGSFAHCLTLSGLSPVAVTSDAETEHKLSFDEGTAVIGSVKQINLETLFAKKPDYVILSADLSAHLKLESSLKNAGIKYGYFRVDTFEDYKKFMKPLCDASGRDDLFEKNVTQPEENIKNISPKIINYDDSKYYVYLGITKDEDNAKKIKKIYSQKGYNIYIKEVKLNNEEFYNNVTQFDLLLNNTNNSNEILKITEVVLANYEETVKSQ